MAPFPQRLAASQTLEAEFQVKPAAHSHAVESVEESPTAFATVVQSIPQDLTVVSQVRPVGHTQPVRVTALVVRRSLANAIASGFNTPPPPPPPPPPPVVVLVVPEVVPEVVVVVAPAIPEEIGAPTVVMSQIRVGASHLH